MNIYHQVEHYLKKMIYSTKVQMMMNKDKRPSQAGKKLYFAYIIIRPGI